MKKRLYIITGASRGIGKALALSLRIPGNRLVCISRSSMKDLLIGTALEEDAIQLVYKDLENPDTVSTLIPEILQELNPSEFDQITLINNAAMLEPVGPCGTDHDFRSIAHIHLNLLTPILLTSSFIHFSKAWPISKTVLNISSGAGSNPYYGWSAYCTSKAGIDMFTRCVGLEQQAEKNGVRILAIAPGVVDTYMQETIRTTDPSAFPDRERFVRLKESGALRETQDVAQDLLRILERTNIPNGSVLDLREMDT